MLFALAVLLLAQDDAASFGKEQRVAAAYYQLSPEPNPAVDFLEMGKAGVDVALVPFGGDAKSLDPLISVLDGLDAERKARPKLAPVVQPGAVPDLAAADAFLEKVPARHVARIDGRPVVWLAPTDKPVEPAALAAAVSRMKRPPYVVAELSWKDAPADRVYGQGSTRGFAIDLPVVTVGPGAANRDEGRVYERQWHKAVQLDARLVAIETWNGAADGVSETAERKRKYLDATRRFIRDFKVHERIVMAKGKWTNENHVAYTIQYTPHEQGLKPVETEEGRCDEVRLRGFEALSSKENKGTAVRRLCFDVDDSFCYFDKRAFEVRVEFWDQGEGSFSLEYDSDDRTLPAERRGVKSAGEVRFTGTGTWRLEVFKLPDAVFGNGQPGGSDFRLSSNGRGLSVRMVMVLKR